MVVRRTIAPIDRDLPVFIGARDEITAAVYALFSQRLSSLLANAVSARVRRDLSIRGQLTRETIAEVVNAIDVNEWRPLLLVARRALEKAAREATMLSLWQVGIDEADPIAETALNDARTWANERALEMIGAKEVGDGELAEDENAEASIAATTKKMVSANLEAISEKDTTADAAIVALGGIYALSASRAELIGQTEIDVAASKGQLIAYGNSGMVNGVRWITQHDNRVEEHCRENERAGIVKMGGEFPSGHKYPPAHPRCRCRIAAVSETVQ